MEKLTLKDIKAKDKGIVLDFASEMAENGIALDDFTLNEGWTFEEFFDAYEKKSDSFDDEYGIQKYFNIYLLMRARDNKLIGIILLFPNMPYVFRRTDKVNFYFAIRPSEQKKDYFSQGIKLAIKKFWQLTNGDEMVIACYKENKKLSDALLENGATVISSKVGILTKERFCFDKNNFVKNKTTKKYGSRSKNIKAS